MKKFISCLILFVICNCGDCGPESQTTKYPEGTMVVMKLDRQNVCQVVVSSSIFWYKIKCPIHSKKETSGINIDISNSSSSSLLSSRCGKPDNTGFIEMYVKEYEIESVKENN